MDILKRSIFAYTTDCGRYRAVIPTVVRAKNFLIDIGKLNNGEGFTVLYFLMQHLKASTEGVYLHKIRKFT